MKHYTPEEDKALVARCLGPRGPDYEAAWKEMTKRCLPILYRVFQNNQSSGFPDPMYSFEDFRQKFFVSLLSELRLWNPSRCNLNTCIYTIGKHLLISIAAYGKRKGRNLIDHKTKVKVIAKDEDADNNVIESAPSIDAFDKIIIDRERLDKVISRLSPKHQKMLNDYSQDLIGLMDAGEAIYAARMVAKSLGMIYDIMRPGKGKKNG
jgi:DNA-directed RNA polymerase specialized sigma24 family protein